MHYQVLEGHNTLYYKLISENENEEPEEGEIVINVIYEEVFRDINDTPIVRHPPREECFPDGESL